MSVLLHLFRISAGKWKKIVLVCSRVYESGRFIPSAKDAVFLGSADMHHPAARRLGLRERVTQHGGAGSLMGDRRGRTHRLFSPQALFSKVSEWNPAGLPSWSPAYIGRPLSYCESGRSPFIRASSVPCSARGFPYRRPNPFSSG